MSRKLVFGSVLVLLLGVVPAFAVSAGSSTLTGTYTVSVDWGDGSGLQSVGTYDIGTSDSDDPLDSLAYTGTYSGSVNAAASAAAGIWGYGQPDADGWSFWLTDGSGVGQNDPGHGLSATVMSIEYDVKIVDWDEGDGQGRWTGWYDQNYLRGTVGGGGSYVGFSHASELYTGSDGAGETLFNAHSWLYFNDTPGLFYVDSGVILPDPVREEFLGDGDYLRFLGTYTFYAENDGGPSSIGFTDNAPPAVPEPTTMLLCGSCLAGLAVFRRRRKLR